MPADITVWSEKKIAWYHTTVPSHRIWSLAKERTDRYFGRIELGVGAK